MRHVSDVMMRSASVSASHLDKCGDFLVAAQPVKGSIFWLIELM